MERASIRLIALVIVYIFYLSVGAAIFSSIEGPYEQRILSDLRQKRDDFLVKHPCVSDKELENFVKHVVAAQDMGIPPLGNASDKRSWGFGSSFFFAGTVVTTIGYGNIAPLSGGGKVFCMVFAVFGIPMTAIMLTAIVERLLQFTEVLEKFLCSTCTVRGVPPAYLRFIHLSLIMCGAIMLVIIIPAIFFMFLEDWSYFEALYFCFISLTTIGLGDFVPGDDPKWRRSEYRSLYKVFCVFFFITGLTFLLLILELCAKIPDDHPGMLFSCHKPFLLEDEADVSATASKVRPRYSISSRGSSSSSPDRQRPSRNSYERISSRDNESR
ncbi:potassium channel subfamily K member 1-like [Stylophora pistillata]|uniref:Potassium channel subfamily K member 1 n=1 Tax=Stylophora pistillata TaxID=50429 RepID=A0A2B4RQD9_STYPI|nr:potassium channel subfamily K member 1-like [Stylophora pistillata]PFX19386.1 Potassium channel subfamily K member 1 [Stylophora pistillata]